MQGQATVVHHGHILLVHAVVNLAAKLVRELEAEVELAEVLWCPREVEAEATINRRVDIAKVILRGRSGIVCGLDSDVAIGIGHVLIEEGLAVGFVHACRLQHVSLVNAAANAEDAAAALDAVLLDARVEVGNLVLEVGEVEVAAQRQVAGLDDVAIDGELNALVHHLAHVGRICCHGRT